MSAPECEPCAENGRYHDAEWMAWQIGGRWIPICDPERQTWWEGGDDPAEIGAPDILFIPIPPPSRCILLSDFSDAGNDS